MKYSVVTFGCRVNQADSLAFEEELIATGAHASAPEVADLVIVNTCSVTATADQGARQTIRRVARDNPTARIVVTGCYATRRPEEVAALPNVVRVVPNDDKPRLVPLLRQSPTARAYVVEDVTSAERFGDGEGSCGARIGPGLAGRTAFTLRVQTGCAEPCAYCIIPSTRGAPRSVPVNSILDEIERVARAGFKEIALTGVHLGSYGRDLSPSIGLASLLESASREAARLDVRLRVSSLEPMDCTPEIVRLAETAGQIAPHFHLPLQHARDRVLAAMRRPYTITYYRSLVDDIRHRMPNASIGSDVIVGFPGESDADFDALVEYLEGSPLTHVHVFPYSDRPGTVATTMPDKVPGAVIRERSRRVREISKRLNDAFLDSQIGTDHRALTLDDGSVAMTGNYLKVRIPPGRVRNEWVRVRIASHQDGELLAG
ncbi:MAG TPA: tRNA (N(6)-L-threonylcarbamoyladenosine(37)-C(2))-methylthiotransferase MtaB [Vicinamibacterales bacterium]